MVWIPNGHGLQVREGFSVPDGTGYIVRKSNYGCSNSWPFYDKWNYTAVDTMPAFVTTFGPYWTFNPSSGHDGSVSTSNNGQIASDRIVVLNVGCPNLPSLTEMYAQTTWISSSQGFNVASGGPMIFCGTTPLVYRMRGYAMCIRNKTVSDNSLGTSTTRIDLQEILWAVGGSDGGSVLASAVFPVDTGAFDNGPMINSHVMKITGVIESGNLRLKCYVDGVLYISYLKSGGFTSGVPGMNFGGSLVAGAFAGGSM